MLFTDIIRTKRDGNSLNDAQIDDFVNGLADGSIPAEQVSALAMAVFINGMSFEEAGRLTLGMANSGAVLDWTAEAFDGPIVDKHSTGGVGDKVSFLLAPIAAACGCYVPMISGRGLGHTGGTVDKIECIPGYQSMPDTALFKQVVKSVGCAVIGQTAEFAPADKRLYAIRDVTATVDSVPLITASILAKKIAGGLDGLVMDVKVGSGAFMPTVERASELAESIIGTAAQAGLKTHAILTDMNEVLGDTAGNALEIIESIRYLKDDYRESRLNQVTLSLCAEMLLLSGAEQDKERAMQRVEEAVTSGRAAEKFGQMIAGLGGPVDFIDHYENYLSVAPIIQPVYPLLSGVLSTVDAIQMGNAIIELGGGRRVMGDALDLAVGLTDIAHIGDTVDKSRPLAVIHGASDAKVKAAATIIQNACAVSEPGVTKNPVIYNIFRA
jgi:thymidine phosphorylase